MLGFGDLIAARPRGTLHTVGLVGNECRVPASHTCCAVSISLLREKCKTRRRWVVDDGKRFLEHEICDLRF